MTKTAPYIIAGPCAAETKEQVLATATQLAEAGIDVFRAGVWKPRTEPGAFEGVGEQALGWLQEVKAQTGLPVITEVATPEHVRLVFKAGLDGFWIGARTTTNPFLVQQIADQLAIELKAMSASDSSDPNHPSTSASAETNPSANRQTPLVLVKNPVSPDVRLWKGAIERLRQAGATRLMAVHRGFQTGQPTPYRNAPVWSIPFALKMQLPSVPLILDPSHMAGRTDLIAELSDSAMKLGYEGLMIEAHCRPDTAKSDKSQQITPFALKNLVHNLNHRAEGEDAGLSGLRRQMEEIDDTLFTLILQRMQLSRQIGDYKRLHNMPVLQEKRYAEILQKRLDWALKNNLDPDAVRRIMDAIHEESCRWQL